MNLLSEKWLHDVQQIMIGLDYCLGRNNRGKNLAMENRSLVAEYKTWIYNESEVIYIEDLELIAEQGNAYLLGVYHSGITFMSKKMKN
jgi:hypothetical protein